MHTTPWPTLLPGEIAALIGFEQAARQVRCLAVNALPFRLNLARRPLVEWSAYRKRMGGVRPPSRATEPNWDALKAAGNANR